MSDPILEPAQTPNEAGTPPEPVTPAAPAAAEPGTPKHTPSEPPAAEPAKPAEPPAEKPADKPADPATPEGAPEKYEFKAPEGQSYDPKVLTAFESAARTANLTQDAAQKLIESMAPALAARQAEQVGEIHKQWADAVLADKEIGGEPTSDAFKQKMGVAQKFVKQFDQDGALGKLLEDTGFGSHPAVLRVLYRAGKAISEDTFVGRGNRDSGPAVDPLAALYPTTVKKE